MRYDFCSYSCAGPKHLQRYVNEFAGQHNIKDKDTLARMSLIALGMVGKRLRYRDLTGGGKAYAFYRQFPKKADMVNISNLREVAIDEAELMDGVLEQQFSVSERGIDTVQVISERENEGVSCKSLPYKELQD